MSGAETIQRRRVTPAEPDVTNIKLVVLGSAGTGKTALVRAFCEQLSGLPPKLEPTIGADFRFRHFKLGSHQVRVNIWDLSGEPDFLDVRNEFYKEAQGVILVCDTTSRRSFQDLEGWLTEMQKFTPQGGHKCTVVGTKIESGPRAVNEQVARDWALTKNASYCEVSVAMGKQIEAPFQDLIKRLV